MMSKVTLGGGGGGGGGGRPPPPPSSSSSSHLSASAPPFTVDRSNSKPLQIPDFQYFAHTWNYSSPVPAAAAIQKDEYLGGGSESKGGDSRWSSVNPESKVDSRWSSVNPSAVAAKASSTPTPPFYYENVPYGGSTGLDNGMTPLVTVSECSYELLPSTGLESAGFSSHVDYTQSLSGLDYPSQWYGLGDAKHGKRTENDGTFPFQKSTGHDSLHYLKQGGDSCKCGNTFVNDYCASCGLFSDSVIIGRESHNGLVHMGHSDNASRLRKDGYLPYDSPWGTSSKSEFTDPISLSLGPSAQSPVKSTTFRNPNDPYEKRVQVSDYGVTESFPSLIRTSNVDLGLGLCRNVSGKSVDNANNDATYVRHHNEVINNYNNISKEKEVRLTLDPGGGQVSQTKSRKSDREEFFSVFPSVIEQPSKDNTTPNGVVGVKFNSNLPKLDLSIGGSFSCDNTAQAIRSQEKYSDCLEHHSTGIDSPCWKGAPSFQLSSPFDVVVEGEATPPHNTKQRSEHYLNRELDQPVKSLSYGVVFAATEQSSSRDGAKAKTKSPTPQASKGVQCCDYSYKPAEEHYMPQPQFCGTEKLLVNEIMNMVAHDSNNIKEGGGSIAVRAAEDVLSSNSLEEIEIVQHPKEKSPPPPPTLDVQVLTNSMKNISELLLSYHRSDPFALKEQSLEAIEDVISNLNALLPNKTAHLTRPPVLTHSQLGTSHVNIDPSRSQVVHDSSSVNAQGHHDYQQPIYEEMKNRNGCGENKSFSKTRDDLEMFLDASITQNIGPAVSKVVQNASVGDKAQSIQQLFQIKDDLDMFGDDSMTKSIKKVLDENFDCGEEIQPLALLFKNLWLEAEARLCRFNYKARFDRVKIEMEGFKSTNQMKESSGSSSSDKDSGTKILPQQQGLTSSNVLMNNAKNGSLKETVTIPSSSANDSNDLEASVLARLKILKGRNSNEFEQQSVVGQGSDSALGLNAAADDLGSANGRAPSELSPGFIDKTSSEWEHVVKDDAW